MDRFIIRVQEPSIRSSFVVFFVTSSICVDFVGRWNRISALLSASCVFFRKTEVITSTFVPGIPRDELRGINAEWDLCEYEKIRECTWWENVDIISSKFEGFFLGVDLDSFSVHYRIRYHFGHSRMVLRNDLFIICPSVGIKSTR